MPALQVRDFPDELYEQLKACAAKEHRSVAQQTIVAVEQMISNKQSGQDSATACSSLAAYDSASAASPSHKPLYLEFDTEAARAARIKKRKELMKRINETRVELPPNFPDPVDMVREVREERDEHFGEFMASVARG